jgi:site-specific recombinase XerC
LSRESSFDISSHRFRHTLATELMKSPDRNLKVLKDLLGHRNVRTTMKYTELDMEVAGSALEQGVVLHTDITITFSVGP